MLTDEFPASLKTIGRDIKEINERFGMNLVIKQKSGVIFEEQK